MLKFGRKDISHEFFDIINKRMMMLSIRIMRFIRFARNLVVEWCIDLCDGLSSCIIEGLVFLAI